MRRILYSDAFEVSESSYDPLTKGYRYRRKLLLKSCGQGAKLNFKRYELYMLVLSFRLATDTASLIIQDIWFQSKLQNLSFN
jgi:hypothetical protein